MSKPMRDARITKEVLLAQMTSHPDAKIRALVPKLRAVKGWTVDQLFEILREMKGVSPDDVTK